MSAPTIDSTSEATVSATASRTVRTGDQTQTAAELQQSWDADPRWAGIERTYTADDVVALRGSVARGAHPRPPRRRAAVAASSHEPRTTSTPSAR